MRTPAANRVTQRFGFVLLTGFLAAEAGAQQQKQAPIVGDFIIRQEWNDNFFTKPDPVPGNRTRFQLRPRFEVETESLRFGLGADVNYSRDNNLEPKDIQWLVPHQANKRIIDATANRVGVREDQVMMNIERYGNTTAGTIPLLLWDYEKQLKKGDNLIIAAFGGGYKNSLVASFITTVCRSLADEVL